MTDWGGRRGGGGGGVYGKGLENCCLQETKLGCCLL